MLATSVRSGLEETTHDGAVAVVDRRGRLLAHHGDIDRLFYLRSAAKPFQALVSQESGASLSPLEMAIVCASHRGFPAHLSLVTGVLEAAGLDEGALRCPPDWPLSPTASRIAARSGAKEPRRLWHNCSGKHAGFLRACVAAGWPTDTYLDPDHPLQREVRTTVSELGGLEVDPVGVDGCGAPVLRTTARAMATLYARLAGDDRLGDMFRAMHAYPALIGVNGTGDSEIAMSIHAAAKGGAAGCVGVAVEGHLGVAAKSWDGDGDVANLAASVALDQLGLLTATARAVLGPVMSPPVSGGGREVGRLEARFELDSS